MPKLEIQLNPEVWERLQKASYWCQYSIHSFAQRAILDKLDEVELWIKADEEAEE